MPRHATTKSSAHAKAKAPPKKSADQSMEQDALSLLTEDHVKVKKMFDRFEKLKAHEGGDRRETESKRMLVEHACMELTIHATIEEEIFYPALREALEETDLIEEARVEHNSAKQLISELESLQPEDEAYDATFTVLCEYVKHHIEEEEKEMFKKAKKADLDLQGLGEELQERKKDLQAEFGVEQNGEEQTEEAQGAAKRKSGKTVH